MLRTEAISSADYFGVYITNISSVRNIRVKPEDTEVKGIYENICHIDSHL